MIPHSETSAAVPLPGQPRRSRRTAPGRLIIRRLQAVLHGSRRGFSSTRGQFGRWPISSHAVTSDVRVRLLMSQTLTLPDRIPRLASCWPGLFWGGVR